MPKDIRHTSEPHDRLTRIGDDMLKTLHEHRENVDKRINAIIILDDLVEHRGATTIDGYDDDPKKMVERLLEHAEEVAIAEDIPLIASPLDVIAD